MLLIFNIKIINILNKINCHVKKMFSFVKYYEHVTVQGPNYLFDL